MAARTLAPIFGCPIPPSTPIKAQFTDATGRTNYYLGDFIGLALANNTGYATWTDTRNGNQDIYSTHFPLTSAPAPPNDQFEPNDTAQTATDLGLIVQRFLPKLAIPAGDQDWFRLQAAATGDLTVTALQAETGKRVRLELWDETGSTLLAQGAELDANGSALGQQIIFPASSGQTYLVRVVPLTTGGSESNGYSLQVQSLTADLGTAMHGFEDGTLGPGDQAYYLLKVPAAGSLEVKLTTLADVQGALHLEVVDPSTLSVLASGSPALGGGEETSLPVTGGQAVLLHVWGSADAQGNFTLEFTNLDQFTTAQNASLLFPAGAGPSQVALGDLNGDNKLDMVVANAGSNTISVLLGNGDGTFQAPRQFAVGAFKIPNPATNGRFPTFRRDVALVDLNHDGIPDVVVTNFDSGDVSVLLGRGDGTFEPQRRYDATAGPFALTVGDLNGDGTPDLAVVDATSPFVVTVAALLGRGDGTFFPERTFQIPFASADNFPYSAVGIADLNGDGKGDLIVSGATPLRVYVYLSNGDGTFKPVIDPADGQLGFPAGRLGEGLAVEDINGDGELDIINTSLEAGAVDVLLGNGDGSFQPLENFIYFPIPHPDFTAGQTPLSVAIADVATSVFNPDGSIASTLGEPDGHPDLIIAASGVVLTLKSVGPPGVFVLPAIWSGDSLIGFDAPHLLAAGAAPQDVKAGDLNSDGVPDVAAVDRDGVLVIFGKKPVIPPNDTPQAARDLGSLVHVVEPTLTLVPGHQDAYYTLTVPIEAAHGAGDEILDFSGLFQALEGAGISMEVRDASGNVLGSGERFRVLAHQGEVLTLHVFGVDDGSGRRGAGAYTLAIDVLPQLVSIEAQPLLPGTGAVPGGPTTSLVLTFQGDRLDTATAEDPANYRVTWLGPDRLAGTADDQELLLANGQGVVYSPSTNVDVASGVAYPTAVRQTVTLLFDQPLPADSYQVEVSAAVRAAPFNEDEADLLTSRPGFNGHPVVALDGGTLVEGSRIAAADLVFAQGALGSLDVWKDGTPFLTQLHADLSALLDAHLTELGDDPAITNLLLQQLQTRLEPAVGAPGQRPVGVLAVWLDPVSVDVEDGDNNHITYDLNDGMLTNDFSDVFVDVVGNMEILIIPTFTATFQVQVGAVPPTAHGGAVLVSSMQVTTLSLTEPLRTGTTTIQIPFVF